MSRGSGVHKIKLTRLCINFSMIVSKEKFCFLNIVNRKKKRPKSNVTKDISLFFQSENVTT